MSWKNQKDVPTYTGWVLPFTNRDIRRLVRFVMDGIALAGETMRRGR